MRKLLAAAAALAVFTAGVSCSKGSSSTESKASPETVITAAKTAYTGTELEIPDDVSLLMLIAPDDGGGFRIVYTDNSLCIKAAVYSSEKKLTGSYELMKAGAGAAAVCGAADGSITVLVCQNDYASPEDNEGKCVEMRLISFDSTGKETSNMEVPNIGTYLTSSFSPVYLTAHGDGFIAGDLHTAVSFDSSGALTGAATADSGVFIESGDSLYYFGIEGWGETDRLAVPSGLNGYGFYQSTNVMGAISAGEYSFTVKLDDGLYGLDGDGRLVKLLDYDDSDVVKGSVGVAAQLKNGDFVCQTHGVNMGLKLFQPKPEGSETERKEIIIGLSENEVNGDLWATVYNQNSQIYRAEIRRYSAENGDEQLKADIISGDAPDVCQMSSPEVMYNFANAGALADLGELSAKYGGMTLDRFMSNIVEAMTYKGKVWAMPQSYMLSGLIADRNVISREEADWDMERFLDISGKMPEGMQLADKYSFYERADLFDMLCTSSLYNWVDYEKCTCNFDSPEFVRVLEFCRDVPVTFSSEFLSDVTGAESAVIATENAAALRNREAMISVQHYISNFNNIASIPRLRTFEMAETTMLPYPSPDCRGMIYPETMYAVSSNGFTEGAWDYLNFIFSDDNQLFVPGTQMTIMSFPVVRSAFEKLKELNQSSTSQGHSNSNGYEVEYPIRLKPEDLEYICGFIENSTHLSTKSCPAAAIALEEFLTFSGGEQTAEQCAKMIQDRVSIYLSENS